MTRQADSASAPVPVRRRACLLGDLLAILSLCVLICSCFWRIALAGRVIAGGDIFTYFYPYWAEATRALRAGRLPLWNPYLFMGVPFLANSQVGVFYPLNWPLWLLLPARRSIHLSVVLHLCLAAVNAYIWGRSSLELRHLGAWTVGTVFALGGYLGAQVEHVNQLQGLAWLPLMFMLYDSSSRRVAKSPRGRGSVLALVGLALVMGLVLLAGHTQTAFISLVGLGVYGLGPALWRGVRRGMWRPFLRRSVLLAVATGLAMALAAVQLIPTWRLSRLSVRAEGLPFSERVSFSLSLSYLARALLPGFGAGVAPEHIEHVAYIGIPGLALVAVAVWGIRHAARPAGRTESEFATSNGQRAICALVIGLVFALGLYNPLYLLLARFVPGFAHFRVPARWLALYAVGAAALAGQGAQLLWRSRAGVDRRVLLPVALAVVVLVVWAVLGARVSQGGHVGRLTVAGWAAGSALTLGLLLATSLAPRLATVGLLALLTVELLAASASLPHTRATAPQAFTSLRPSIAHLLADQPRGAGGRFLSMSDITFDPGDLPAIRTIYGPQLSDDALYDYVIAAKQKEVLSPNLPLAFSAAAVDGYGGGVLPLARYVALQRLFLPRDRVSIDGRLRENLTAIPEGRWLNLFNVRHLITDKLHDVWIDDVFYDLQFGARLSQGERAAVGRVPVFESTALGVVYRLQAGSALPDDSPVGVVEVGFDDGSTKTFMLRAGGQTSEERDKRTDSGEGEPARESQVTRLRWPEPTVPISIAARATLPEGELVVRGMSLIDERTGGFRSLVLSDRGRFRLAHSGDVKIYENLDALPRAFIVHSASVASSDEEALAAMRDPAFDPAAKVILAAGGAEASCSEMTTTRALRIRSETATVTSYWSERVEIDVRLSEPGYLVLSDAWYPGWRATVDGEAAEIRRADVLFRAVAVGAGHHRVVFSFHPRGVLIGGMIALAGMLCLIALAAADLALPKGAGSAIMG